jgi:hypothetical protein
LRHGATWKRFPKIAETFDFIGDPSRTNNRPEINQLHWLTRLKMVTGRNTLFQALAHPKNRSCNATMACGRPDGMMVQPVLSKAGGSLRP